MTTPCGRPSSHTDRKRHGISDGLVSGGLKSPSPTGIGRFRGGELPCLQALCFYCRIGKRYFAVSWALALERAVPGAGERRDSPCQAASSPPSSHS